MVGWASPLWPMEFALGFLDGDVVDAGFTSSHQTFVVKFPVLVPVSPKPLTVGVVVFVLKTYCDPVSLKGPQLFGKSVFKFVVPLVRKEFANGIATVDKLATVTPLTVDRISH